MIRIAAFLNDAGHGGNDIGAVGAGLSNTNDQFGILNPQQGLYRTAGSKSAEPYSALYFIARGLTRLHFIIESCAMLMRSQMISPNTDVESALPVMVASVPPTRVVVIHYPAAILKWRTREPRERE